MYLVFALLVVVVIAAGTIVALRHPQAGVTTSPTPDGPVTAIGSGIELGAEDLRRVRFPIVFRGYRPAEVDALLDALAVQLDTAPTTAEPPTSTSAPDNHVMPPSTQEST